MMRSRYIVQYLVLGFCLSLSMVLSAQQVRDSSVVQFSGLVVEDVNGAFMPIPYVNIYIKGTDRGTWSSNDGFFLACRTEWRKRSFFHLSDTRPLNIPFPILCVATDIQYINLLPKDTIFATRDDHLPLAKPRAFQGRFSSDGRHERA